MRPPAKWTTPSMRWSSSIEHDDTTPTGSHNIAQGKPYGGASGTQKQHPGRKQEPGIHQNHRQDIIETILCVKGG